MTYITETLENNQYEPYQALIFHKNRNGDNYLQLHDVERGQMKDIGQTVKKSTFAEFVEASITKEELTPKRELFNPNVLYSENRGLSRSLLVWQHKACIKQLKFDKELGIKSRGVAIPSLVFAVVDKRDLYVWAIKDNEVKEDTKMYYPPFFNIMTGQKVCLGSAKIANEDMGSVNGLIKTYEDLFFESYFTAIHEGGKMDDNMNLFWAETKHKTFPEKKLIPLKNSGKELTFIQALNNL